MWYLLKVDALIGAFVFSGAALFILAMFAWQEAKAYAAPLRTRSNDLAIGESVPLPSRIEGGQRK